MKYYEITGENLISIEVSKSVYAQLATEALTACEQFDGMYIDGTKVVFGVVAPEQTWF